MSIKSIRKSAKPSFMFIIYSVSSESTMVKPSPNQSYGTREIGFKLSWPQANCLYAFHACVAAATTASCRSFVGPVKFNACVLSIRSGFILPMLSRTLLTAASSMPLPPNFLLSSNGLAFCDCWCNIRGYCRCSLPSLAPFSDDVRSWFWIGWLRIGVIWMRFVCDGLSVISSGIGRCNISIMPINIITISIRLRCILDSWFQCCVHARNDEHEMISCWNNCRSLVSKFASRFLIYIIRLSINTYTSPASPAQQCPIGITRIYWDIYMFVLFMHDCVELSLIQRLFLC